MNVLLVLAVYVAGLLCIVVCNSDEQLNQWYIKSNPAAKQNQLTIDKQRNRRLLEVSLNKRELGRQMPHTNIKATKKHLKTKRDITHRLKKKTPAQRRQTFAQQDTRDDLISLIEIELLNQRQCLGEKRKYNILSTRYMQNTLEQRNRHRHIGDKQKQICPPVQRKYSLEKLKQRLLLEQRRHLEQKRKQKLKNSILHKTLIKTANQQKYNLTDPTFNGNFKCGDKSLFKTLTYANNSTRDGYQIVAKEIELTNKGPFNFHITKIQKVINPCLWKRYLYERTNVMKENNDANEMLLFHGSSDPQSVVLNGFDERYSGLGGRYGAGLYFAGRSSKSNEYAIQQEDGSKIMLVCRVILGKPYREANEKYRHYHAPVGYNSLRTARGSDDTEYVIYRGEQAYPEYLVTYTASPKPHLRRRRPRRASRGK